MRCPDETCDCGGVRIECYSRGGEGEFDGYEDDPLWYQPGEMECCHNCGGSGRLTACAKAIGEEDEAWT